MMYILFGIMVLLTIYEVGCILVEQSEKRNDYQYAYNAVIHLVKAGKDPQELLNQAKSDLHYGEFNKGWKDACKEHLND